MAKWRRIVDDLWEPDSRELAVKDCRRSVTRALRKLGPPRSMSAEARMAANVIIAECRGCGLCERGL